MGMIPKWTRWSEARVLEAAEFQIPECAYFAGGVVWLWTHPAPEPGRVNEDSLCVIPLGEKRGVIAVADGMGGVRGGGAASATAVHALWESLKDLGNIPIRTAILDGIEKANERVLATGLGNATTLTVLEIDEGITRLYQVGDSGALIFGNRGRMKDRTTLHSPVGYAVESGLVEPEEALHSEERNIVSNFVGSAEMRIEIGVGTELARYDTCIIGSDGLFDNLSQDEIVEIARTGSISQKGEKILQRIETRMRGEDPSAPSKPDDTTVVLFQLVSEKE